ncbi:hypothetical protein VNI00_007152 [Paramarasmius palmivorus]|uniref:Protein kinase domain-containing protein n=1 Tax=Paramarasmius palmivorus TaxID=297713 RepID=A0AAW0D476_9AGAR
MNNSRNGSLTEFLRRIVSREGGPPVGLGLPPYLYPSSTSTHTITGLGLTETSGRSRTASYPGSNSFGMSVSNSLPGMHQRGRSGSFSGAALGEVEREWDLVRFMHEIAKGMEYLHGNGVLHGDLKAANVLVDDRIHCVISDFGQSEMKSEAYRISGTPIPHGTLRWQAPELMAGHSQSQLTVEMDVYAFAITCIEVLSMGRMPWPLQDDDAETTPGPRYANKTHFGAVARDLKALRKGIGAEEDLMSPTPNQKTVELEQHSPSPFDPTCSGSCTSPESISDASFRTARERQRDLSTSPTFPTIHPHEKRSVATPQIHMPEPVIYTPSNPSSATSSLFGPSTGSQSEDGDAIGVVDNTIEDGYDSPPPANEGLADTRNERRYRMLLVHDFHPSCLPAPNIDWTVTLPLWSPSPIAIGAVGYLSKPKGAFVTLFNAFNPEKSGELGL